MGWELNFMAWGHGWWTSPSLDQMIPWVTHLGSQAVVIFFIILSLVLTRQKKIFGRLAILYAVQSAVLYGLKYLIQRPRPPILWTLPSALSRGPGEILDPSFPSGHTLYAFMMATLLADWFPRWRFILYAVAGFVGWTRVYLGIHYPTDVIAGGILGYGLTKLFLAYLRSLWVKRSVGTSDPALHGG
jgi:undecaprenyl-diphosphatase